jgi:hypothetical protein
MRKTQLIVFTRPNNAITKPGTVLTSETLISQGATYSPGGSYYLQKSLQPNNVITPQTTYQYNTGSKGKELDLYDDVSIPITFSILDIREPEKRKTSWSKTITIPGTANNNRVFTHIYQISADAWTTIAGVSVYQAFNPNLRTEVVLLNDGVQVMKGNMQLKKATRDKFGKIEYEIAINGDLTSLFYDVGDAKLNDLDWSDYDHIWSKQNITNSWNYSIKKGGVDYNNFTQTLVGGYVKGISKEAATGRLSFTTNTAHGLQVGDFVRIMLDDNIEQKYRSATGEWLVMSKTSTTFTVNYFYPIALSPLGENPNSNIGTAYKVISKGQGYVYPLINWGDNIDDNSYPATSFAPGFFIKEIFDKIMQETNSSYQSDFLDSQFFKRLIMLQKKTSYDLNPAEVASRKFWVGLTASYKTSASAKPTQQFYYLQTTNTGLNTATVSSLPSSNPTRVPFKKESGYSATASFYDMGATASGATGNWDENTYLWNVSTSGEYNLTCNLKFSGSCVMNGFADNFSSIGTASFEPGTYSYYPGAFKAGVSSPWRANGCGIRIIATMFLNRNGVVSQIGDVKSDHFYMNTSSVWDANNPNWLNFGTYQPANWRNFELKLTSGNTYFAKNDQVWVEVKYYVQASANGDLVQNLGFYSSISFHELDTTDPDGYAREDIRGDWYLNLLEQSYIFNDPTPKAVENSFIDADAFLPKDMSCKDFLLTIIKMFNLHIEPDKQIERKYYIEPRDDYYYKGTNTTDFVDWTDKIDNTSVEILPMGELVAKYYTFENKAETDYYNKKFKEDRGREYMYYKKEVVNDFLKNEVKISVPVGSTVMINYPAQSDVVIPAVYQLENNNTIKPVSNSAPRILFWGGIRPFTAQRGGAQIQLANPQTSYTHGWEIISSVAQGTTITATSGVPYNYYPYAGTVDSPHDPYYDINWFNMELGDFVYWDMARWTNSNLYNEYWSNMIDEITDPASKVIKARLYLTPKDIFNLDFRKIYLIDGNYLRLQKVIDYDPVSDGLTQCEFLKLISPTKWGRQSIVVDAWGQVGSEFATGEVINPGPIPSSQITSLAAISTNVKQYAPAKKRPDFGWTNTSPAVSLSSNATIQTNGISNFVSASAKNVKLNGNENQVGDGAENIHISSGNGNFISGGVKNVNVIGTDKKFIQEDDITYINGIRFKYGVALSRSSVIDAGEDVALVKSSNNTTATIIDAAEDVVINAGSTTFENIIDAGNNRILPDLPELGVGTLVNPNPRTNSSNSYDIISPTFSVVEYIRQVSLYKS